MQRRSVLAVFLIIILLLAGCSHSRQAAVSDAPIKNNISQSNKTPHKTIENEGSQSSQPASADEKKLASNESRPEAGEAVKTEPGGQAKVRLVVTRDYGATVIFDQWVAVQDQQNALSLTKSYLDVKTSYGGSFINSINGLASGYTGKMKKAKQDWFLYANGVLAGTGAENIKVNSGDVVWWDYHDWGSAAFTPAMIGAFPHPFANGVWLAFSPSAREAADLMVTALSRQGINRVQLQEADNDLLQKRPGPTIILGLREEIAAMPAIQALNSNPQRTGLFCSFSESGFKLLDAAMQVGEEIAGGGCVCIEATASGMGDGNPLWLVVADDKQGLEQAVSFFSQGQVKPDHAWGVVLGPQGPIPLPLR